MTTTSSPAVRPRAVRRRRWPWIVTGALLLSGVGGVYLVRTRGEATVAATPTTATAVVQRGVLRVSVSGPGTLEASATRTVGADLTATVGALPAVGERVTRGQLLTTLGSDKVEEDVGAAELNLRKARSALASTRANQASSAAQRRSSVTAAQGNVTQAAQTLADARSTLAGQEKLHAIGALSNQALADSQAAVTKAQLSLDSARASLSAAQTQAQTGANSDAESLISQQLNVEQAQAALETAQKARTDLKVYAPISGVVSSVGASEGSVVNSGATILTILDDASLNLPVQVDETEISGVTAGQRAEVTLDAFDGETFSGKVVRVSPGATQSSGISVFTAIVQLDNPDGRLRSGMTAEAEIIQSEARGLIVPRKAIQTVRTRSYVELPAVGDAEPERVRVTLGATDGTNTVVTGGLEAGQEIVVPGARATGTAGTATSGAASPGTGTPGAGTRINPNQGGFGPPPGGFP